ncbi:MAG: TonB-dependent receptor [Brevundimonas sp.]|nr:MAG: TonB-dependent receptor [Brevundimonas sp.]
MNQSNNTGRLRALKTGASALVLSALVAAMAPAAALAQDAPQPQAQDEDSTELGEVIVTGQRRALQTSQQIRRNADTVVDSITATDIGAFPDKSVAEALQRVPGVTVNRFAASDDTSHFGAEPSGVLVRGLQQVRSEYNGRDTFSANSGRGLSWGDISPELMQGVDTYKNQTAEMVEGGIAGTINLRTRVPFDSAGELIQASATVNYGDLSKNYTPEASAIYSNRWDTELGEFGLLANVAYSDVTTQSQTIQYGRMGVFRDVFGPGDRYIPASVGNRDTEYNRTRNGLAFAGQWRSPDRDMLVTAQYNRSDFTNEWRERAVIAYNADMYSLPVNFVYTPTNRAHWIPNPGANGTPFTFDSQGNFRSGTLLVGQTDTGWWGVGDADAAGIAVNDQGVNMLEPCYSWQPTCTNPYRAGEVNALTRYNETSNMTEDFGINMQWDITDRFRIRLDAQYINSEVENYDIEVGQYTFADLTLDYTGDRPVMNFSAPTNINQSAGGLTNANNYRYNHVMDHREDSEGDELALRADAEFDIGSTWLDSVRFGVRYADRSQRVNYSAYNWGNIANLYNFNQAAYWNIDRHTANGSFTGYPTGLYETRSFGSDFFGANGQYVFFDMDRLANHDADLLSYDRIGAGQDQWRPICERTGEVADSCYRPNELNEVGEETTAAYVMLRFGGENATFGGSPFSGNIGVRYVETNVTSTGSLSYPIAFSPTTLQCTGAPPDPMRPPTLDPIGCYISPDEIAFNSGGGIRSTAESSSSHWLPSFNIKFDVREDWVLRFAASRAISRPDIGLLKNYVEITASLPGNDPTDPRYVSSGGAITGVNPTYNANAYNPYLEPVTADQFDLALEHYFANAGSLTFTAFYKTFDNYIQYGSYDLDVTNNGVTRTVRVRGPMNGDGAQVRGIEMAYQQFFDFLPGPWAGFGVQANYTYIDNQGVRNTNLKVASGGSSGETAQPGSSGTVLQVDRLEGLSDHQYNLVGMYERGPWAARLAYNWRSEYLVTAVDCCVFLPIWQEAAGFLDGSVRYAVNDNLELSLQGSNLLSTESRLFQQVNDSSQGGTLTPNAWLKSDRRVVLGLRYRF